MVKKLFSFLRRRPGPSPADSKVAMLRARVADKNAEIKELRAQAEILAGNARRLLAWRLLRGNGLEIGALASPLPLPPGATAKYYDYLSKEENIRRFPHLPPEQFVDVDFIGQCEQLDLIPDGSLDFLIANHVLEHSADVIKTLVRFHDKLKEGGVLFVTLPDKRYTFDCDRPVTSFDHLWDEYLHGSTPNDYAHYLDYHRHVAAKTGGPPLTEEQFQQAGRVDIHVHVWTQKEIIELLLELDRRKLVEWEIEAAMREGGEFIVVARRIRVRSWDRTAPENRSGPSVEDGLR